MNNETIASILSALTGNTDAVRPAQAQSDPATETVKCLAAIAGLCVSHPVVGPYMTDDRKKTVGQVVDTANYLGDTLTCQQADMIVKDLNRILNDVEQNIMDNLTQVLQAAGVRM